MIGKIGKSLPWWVKIGVKLTLGFIPNKYVLFRRIGFFKHGFMMDANYALGVFFKHFDRIKSNLPENFCVLELGPGDSIATAVIAYAFGAEKIFLVDTGRYATESIIVYKELIKNLMRQKTKKDISKLLEAEDINDILELTNSVYLTDGVASLEGIPNCSVDFIFSNAVLEHVYLKEFNQLLSNFYRISSGNCLMSHTIDLKDHIKDGLNSLRISRKVWESRLFRNSGFYTNRLRYQDICNHMRNSGFDIVNVQPKKWDRIPLELKHMDWEFKNREDLDIHGMDIICKKVR